MSETARCTGHCCKSFWLPVSPMELQHELKKFQLTGRSRWSDIEKIAPMVILQRTSRQCGHNSPKSNKVEYYYTCKHFDAASGNCMNYEDRPAMCRDYPYGRQCSYKACTRREECQVDKQPIEEVA